MWCEKIVLSICANWRFNLPIQLFGVLVCTNFSYSVVHLFIEQAYYTWQLINGVNCCDHCPLHFGRCRHIVLIFVLIVAITIPLGWTVHGDFGRGQAHAIRGGVRRRASPECFIHCWAVGSWVLNNNPWPFPSPTEARKPTCSCLLNASWVDQFQTVFWLCCLSVLPGGD